jgi:hypothetical protein
MRSQYSYLTILEVRLLVINKQSNNKHKNILYSWIFLVNLQSVNEH